MTKRSTSLWLLLTLVVVAACGQATVEQSSAAPSRPAPNELLRNGKVPVEGVLTGGQPTPEQFEELAKLGYQTVINLRSPEEDGSTDPELVESLGMTYLSLPITGSDDIGEAGGRKLAEALASADYPVVVHCGSGNRVGALFAMKGFYVDGQTPEEALALGRAAGVTRLEPVVKQQLGLE